MTETLSFHANWRRSAISRFESLWALTQKFVYLNALTRPSDVLRLLGKDAHEATPFTGHGEFHQLKRFSASRLARAFDMTPKAVAYATLAPYALPIRAAHECFTCFAGAAMHLRYCLRCMAIGFHSPLYQCLWVARCPIHDVALSDHCPRCGRLVSYEFSAEAIEEPFACTNCRHRLWSDLTAVHWPRLSAAEEQTLYGVVRWYRAIRRDKRFTFRDMGFTAPWSFKGNEETAYTDLQSVPGRWANLRPLSAWPHAALRRHDREVRRDVELGERLVTLLPQQVNATASGQVREANLSRELYATYRCIKRHLAHRLLARHRSCVPDYRRLTEVRRIEAMQSLCPWGFAFALWERSWESGEKWEERPGGRRRRVACKPEEAIAQRMEPFFSEAQALLGNSANRYGARRIDITVHWLAARVLGLSLLMSFDWILHPILSQTGENPSHGHNTDQHNRTPPYFLIEIEAASEACRLHWWAVPILDRLIHYDRSCRHSSATCDAITEQVLSHWRLQHQIRSYFQVPSERR